MDRESLRNLAPLDPSRPEEYLEALRRFVGIGFDEWDRMPDGDGETLSPDEGEAVATKTDLFRVISGCALYALDLLKLAYQVNNEIGGDMETAFQDPPKFKEGQRVKIVRLLDEITSRELIGLVGTVEEVDPLPNGEYNYYVEGRYMHEAELEVTE